MNAAVDPYILQQASCRASLLVATAGFGPDEWQDLCQELIFDCLRRSPRFDPSRGDWPGFVRGVVRNQASALVTRRNRTVRREVLAEDLLHHESAWADDLPNALGASNQHEIAAGLEMSIDVQRVLNGLHPQLRNLALLLSELPVLEVCVKTGKSRSRVRQLTLQLREAFVRAGFRPRHSRKRAVKQLSLHGQAASQ